MNVTLGDVLLVLLCVLVVDVIQLIVVAWLFVRHDQSVLRRLDRIVEKAAMGPRRLA